MTLIGIGEEVVDRFSKRFDGEVGAVKFGEDSFAIDDVGDAVVGEDDFKDVFGEEKVEFGKGVGDNGGKLIAGELEGDGA